MLQRLSSLYAKIGYDTEEFAYSGRALCRERGDGQGRGLQIGD